MDVGGRGWTSAQKTPRQNLDLRGLPWTETTRFTSVAVGVNVCGRRWTRLLAIAPAVRSRSTDSGVVTADRQAVDGASAVR